MANPFVVRILNARQLAALEKLKDEMGNYPVVLVNSDDMMRGVDYRSDSKGISLVVDKSFSTSRDALQGLARVGRFGDECRRYLVGGVELFNRTTDMAKYQEFFKFAQLSVVPSKPAKRQIKASSKEQTKCENLKQMFSKANAVIVPTTDCVIVNQSHSKSVDSVEALTFKLSSADFASVGTI